MKRQLAEPALSTTSAADGLDHRQAVMCLKILTNEDLSRMATPATIGSSLAPIKERRTRRKG